MLARLTPGDLRLLAPHLELLSLDRRQSLERPHKPIEHLYFMEHGIASIVACNDLNAHVEIGVVGREGVTGLAALLGNSTSPHETYIQVAGDARRIGVGPLREAVDRSAALRDTLLRYAHVFMIQTASTAVASAKGSVEERLARWLLMAHDRIDGDDLPLTHEFIGTMLSVRRSGVTDAIQALQKRGMIRSGRATITVVDREALVERAGSLYGEPESEYNRQLGPIGSKR